MKKIYLITIFLLFNSIISANDLSGTIRVVITDFRNDKGSLKIALFNSKEGFPDNGKKAFIKEKTTIRDKKAEFIFNDIPYGIYAVSIYHDENGNDKLDSNFLGIPKEGYGASNNPNPSMRPPRFDEAKFKLDSASLNIEIKAQY
ncbi:MAG: DUF2141 domain-containing protein [bacterium]